MINDYIDVDYVECKDEEKSNSPDITINADPISTAVKGISDVVNNLTTSIKEYNICKQHEETQRAQIKAQLKLGMAQIEAKKEIILKALDDNMNFKMNLVQKEYELTLKTIDQFDATINVAIEIARKNMDISGLLELVNSQHTIVQMHSEFTLKMMDKNISDNTSNVMGYLE